jgi:hypothetical protein
MKKAVPTRTTNRIRLTDLEDKRFEDFVLMLIYPIANWTELSHVGRCGKDGGVDIHAIEQIPDGLSREWVIQCKRVEKASASHVQRAVDEAMSNRRSLDVLLLVLACDLSATARDSFKNHAKSKGIKTPIVWTLSEIEARLYNERKDLLFSYFGISEVREARLKEVALRKNINIKHRMRCAFEQKLPDLEKARNEMRHQFAYASFIIRSIDDSSYPEVDSRESGHISSWFRVEPWDYYWNGVEVCLGGVKAIIDRQLNWALIDINDEHDRGVYSEVSVIRIGRIPFRNIIDFDDEGDEYYRYPHIFCTFVDGGTPYEDILFEINDQSRRRLDPAKRLTSRESTTG